MDNSTTEMQPLALEALQDRRDEIRAIIDQQVQCAIQTMGLPSFDLDTLTARPTGPDRVPLPSTKRIRFELINDENLHSRIAQRIERDLAQAVARQLVWEKALGGWLKTTSFRRTWRCATARARKLFAELQGGYEVTVDAAELDLESSADANLCRAEHEAHLEMLRPLLDKLTGFERELLLAGHDPERTAYRKLALESGQTTQTLRQQACRLRKRLRSQLRGM